MPGTQQILWGSDKLFVVTHDPAWKIEQALELVTNCLANTIPYTYNPDRLRLRRDQEGFLTPEVYKVRRKNHNKLQKALTLLEKNGYIQSFTLTSFSPLDVQWLKKYKAPEVKIVSGRSATEVEPATNPHAKLRPRKTNKKVPVNERQWPKWNSDYPEFTPGGYNDKMASHKYGSIKDKND